MLGRERAIHFALEVMSCWHVHVHVWGPGGGKGGLLSSGEPHSRVEGKEGSGPLPEACACASTWCWLPVLRSRGWGRRGGAVAGWMPSMDSAIDCWQSACAQVQMHALRPVTRRCELRQKEVSSHQVAWPFLTCAAGISRGQGMSSRAMDYHFAQLHGGISLPYLILQCASGA